MVRPIGSDKQHMKNVFLVNTSHTIISPESIVSCRYSASPSGSRMSLGEVKKHKV